MMTASVRRPCALGAAVIMCVVLFAAGCNQRTPILDTNVVTTAPSQLAPVAPPAPDNLARIAFTPPGNLGGGSGVGTVYLDLPARNGGRVVSLRSADDSRVSVPAQIIVAEGALSADFSFTTRAVQQDVNVTITATSGERTISDYISVWKPTTSFFAYTADPGMTNGALVQRISSDANGRLSGSCNTTGGGLVASASLGTASSLRVFFAGPRGQLILPGIYDNATNTSGTPGNYLNVEPVTSCQGIGRVELHEVRMIDNGIATALWFTFEQRCLNKPGAVRGIFRLVVPDAAPTARQCLRMF